MAKNNKDKQEKAAVKNEEAAANEADVTVEAEEVESTETEHADKAKEEAVETDKIIVEEPEAVKPVEVKAVKVVEEKAVKTVEPTPVNKEEDKTVKAEEAEPVKAKEILPVKTEEPEAVKTEEPKTAEAEKAEVAKTTAASETQTEEKKSKKEKRKYGKVLPTGSFIGAFVLMLIPGVNIICVLLWSLGASKNRNKVNFSRACIVLFLIELLLTVILCGAGYIYAKHNEDRALTWLDRYTGGLITYFDINRYEDLTKLKNASDYLVPKETEDPETTEKEVQPVCYVYNPVGIDTYEDFLKLWSAKDVEAAKTTASEETTAAPEAEAAPVDDNAETQPTVAAESAMTLEEFLNACNISPEKSQTVYIIIDNEFEKCVIAFDPTGELQCYPNIQVNNEIIYVGGAY